MSEPDKYYQILGLNPGASEEEIIEAYKVLVKVWHPARFKDDPLIQKIATQKIKEIDEAFKQLLIWAENRQEKGEEIIGLEVEAKTEPPETRESIDVKADPMQELIVKVGNVFVKLKLEEPESGTVWKDPYLGMEFVYVKGGIFEMGDVFGDGRTDEIPVHKVHVDDFWMGKYLVTEGDWKKVVLDNPSRFKSGANYPVEQVSWYDDVEKFIRNLNKKTGINYRLPTEAEWEYAARSGGKKEEWAGTNSESEIDEYAWCSFNSGGKTHPVGQKKPNGLGLHDMSGNIWEWVQDWYDKNFYKNSPRDNPQRSGYGDYKVIRGGSSESEPESLRTTSRHSFHPLGTRGIGFLLVLSAKDVPGVVTETDSTKQKDISQSVTEPLVSQPDSTNLEPKSYVSLRPTIHKDEGRADVQSVKPTHGGLGVGPKIGLTVTVFLIGGMIHLLLRDIVGHGHYMVLGIMTFIIWYIWSRPG